MCIGFPREPSPPSRPLATLGLAGYSKKQWFMSFELWVKEQMKTGEEKEEKKILWSDRILIFYGNTQ